MRPRRASPSSFLLSLSSRAPARPSTPSTFNLQPSTARPRRASGFTLVEVMIAMVLGALILGGGFMALRTGFTILEQARDNTRVTQILQSEMERLRGLRFETIAALPTSESFTLNDQLISQAFAGRYQLVRRISPYQGRTDQFLIRLEASWEVAGVPKSQVFISLYTKDGLYDYYYRTF